MKTIKIPDITSTRDSLMSALRMEKELRTEGWSLRLEEQPGVPAGAFFTEPHEAYVVRQNGVYVKEFDTAGQAADWALSCWMGCAVEIA